MNNEEWLHPDWDAGGRCYNWRNHLTDNIKIIWDSFNEDQKFAIYENAELSAENEEWE